MTTAVRTDAASDRLYRDSDILNFKQAYVFGLHFYLASNLGAAGVIFVINDNTTTDKYEYIGVGSDGRTLTIASRSSASGSEVSASGSALTVGVWNHLAVVRSAIDGTLTAYLNAVQDAQLTNDLTGSNNCSRMELGGFSTNNYSPVDGRFAYPRGWAGLTMNASQIGAEMNAESAVITSNLYGDWPLQTDYADISGNGRDWTSAGTLTFEDGPTLSGGGSGLRRRALRLGTLAGLQQGMH